MGARRSVNHSGGGRSRCLTPVPRAGRRSLPLSFCPGVLKRPVWAPDGRFVVYSGPEIGTTYSVKAVTPEAAAHSLPALTLTRGTRQLAFLRGGRALVLLRGDIQHKNLWLMGLETGAERQLTNLTADFDIDDFDISPDGVKLSSNGCRSARMWCFSISHGYKAGYKCLAIVRKIVDCFSLPEPTRSRHQIGYSSWKTARIQRARPSPVVRSSLPCSRIRPVLRAGSYMDLPTLFAVSWDKRLCNEREAPPLNRA